MAEKSTPAPYVPGGGTLAESANAEYQKALEDMLTALDTRKSRLFDPQLLALSKGFLAPNPSGSFFSSLGNAADEAGKAQLEQEKENREIAQARLGLAGQKVGLASQQSRDLAARQFLADMNKPGAGGVGMAASDEEDDGGIQLFPPNPNFLTGKQYIAQQLRLNPGADLAALQKDAIELDRKNIHTTDKAAFNLGTGKMYPVIGHGTTNIVIDGQEYPVSEGIARKFSIAQARGMNKGDWSEYLKIRDMILNGIDASAQPPKATAAPAPTAGAPAPSAAPSKAPTAGQAATTFGTTETPRLPGTKSKSQSEIDKAVETEQAKQRVQDSAKFEATIPEKNDAAREMYSLASRVEQRSRESENFLGIFDRPGLLPALGTALSGGFRTKDGTFDVKGFESAITKLLPGVSENDIKNINLIAGDLADIELVYTKLRMGGQGPLTEGERAIVRRIGGSVSENPASLLAKMKLVKMRAQYDIDVYSAFNQYMQNKPEGNWREFSIKELPKMRQEYDNLLAKAFKTKAAAPSSPKGSSPASKSEGADKSRQIINGWLGIKP